jgi:hypothetical protein
VAGAEHGSESGSVSQVDLGGFIRPRKTIMIAPDVCISYQNLCSPGSLCICTVAQLCLLQRLIHLYSFVSISTQLFFVLFIHSLVIAFAFFINCSSPLLFL